VARLGGRIHLPWLKRVPGVSVVLKDGEKEQSLPSRFSVSGDRYELSFQVPTEHLPRDGQVAVEITFDTFFVPRELGLNEDCRKLVLFTPDTVSLTAPQRPTSTRGSPASFRGTAGPPGRSLE